MDGMENGLKLVEFAVMGFTSVVLPVATYIMGRYRATVEIMAAHVDKKSWDAERCELREGLAHLRDEVQKSNQTLSELMTVLRTKGCLMTRKEDACA